MKPKKDIKDIVDELHPLEIDVIPCIDKKNTPLAELEKDSNLKSIEVMRAVQWMENKNIITKTEKEEELILLDKNGEKYQNGVLPERVILDNLQEPRTLDFFKKLLDKNEINIAIGLLKKKGDIDIKKDKKGLTISITDSGKKTIKKESLEEKFLQKKFPLQKELLSPEEKFAFENLKKRKNIVKLDKVKLIHVSLTELGNHIKDYIEANKIKSSDKLGTFTKDILVNKKFKEKEFRHYDVGINVPKIYGGRKHPLNAILDLLRDVFIEMGFKEMKGPWVETSFWCMDSMWIPQDHPAREAQDTFYLPYKGKLPGKKITDAVKEVHETGGKTGSKGYGYKWNPEMAKQLVLRTHTTATTFRYFGEKGINKLEKAKYFYIGRTFRNETIDATHLPEFHQVEGFIMQDGLTLRHLMGVIKKFYSKLGLDDIKFKVTYNPYTEPSLEAMYYDKTNKRWMELINSGIFRPESLAPYGITKPVIAWGLGVERLAMVLHKRGKLKELLGATCDIEWLRNYKAVMRGEE